MKRKFHFFTFIYQWCIFVPLFTISTIMTAISTIILAPIFKDSDITYWPARKWSRFACKGMCIKTEIIGREKIDSSQSYVFAANHQSAYDIFLIYGWLNNRFKWIMKKELRKIPLVGAACESAGHIFIDRSSTVSALKSIETAQRKLQNGASITVFPEGTRSATGKMGKFKRGAFTIAGSIGLPIVPLTIKGTFEVMPKNSYNIHSGKLTLIIHDPIPYSKELFEDNQQVLINQVHDIIEQGL
ncbi:lysophospholipid acyltransferase family protein [Microbacter margulisiae]|uniref:1-acyl-sn-glycerol-3-phosphate acyltransferase n=1 Tax=Microbacter margulisiae TaxID=1350067 RepID=A0A7W5H2T7_9PORP|nr:lysophospholipid acyltransferase family protein [Microbacter margulisiae]MBB3187909.1 1-acyl-sn-glycerol-3-phosphate acyltransferase [Microbacter margulisiae]